MAPARVLAPIAVDTAQGWLLLPDVRFTAHGHLVDLFVSAMPAYGPLQRNLAARLDQMLAKGVADIRPAALSSRFAEAVAIVGEAPAGITVEVAESSDFADAPRRTLLSMARHEPAQLD